MKDKVNNMLEKRPDYIKDSSISFKSKILRLLGYTLIGNPNSYGLSKDFYDMPADREMPNPKFFNQEALVKNVKTNNIRRQILAKTSGFCFSILMLIFILIFGLILIKGINTSLPDELNNTENEKVSINKNKMSLKPCNQVLDIYYYGKRETVSKQDIIRCNVEAE
jgi:hypothetical protein